MDLSRTPPLVAAVVSFAAALFAIGAGVTSNDDDQTVAPTVASVLGSSVVSPPDVAPAGEESPAAERFDIAITDFDFGPAEAVVAVGTEVVWTNNDGFDHTVVANGNAFPASPNLGEGDTYSFTFTEPGTYAYICGIHPQMTGTIVVEG